MTDKDATIEDLPPEVQDFVSKLKAEFGDNIGVDVITLPSGIVGGDNETEISEREMLYNMGSYHAQQGIARLENDLERRMAQFWLTQTCEILMKLQGEVYAQGQLLEIHGINPSTGRKVSEDETVN